MSLKRTRQWGVIQSHLHDFPYTCMTHARCQTKRVLLMKPTALYDIETDLHDCIFMLAVVILPPRERGQLSSCSGSCNDQNRTILLRHISMFDIIYSFFFHPGNATSFPHARIHAAYSLPLHVDQQRRHLCHDGWCHNHSSSAKFTIFLDSSLAMMVVVI